MHQGQVLFESDGRTIWSFYHLSIELGIGKDLFFFHYLTKDTIPYMTMNHISIYLCPGIMTASRSDVPATKHMMMPSCKHKVVRGIYGFLGQ